jgi:hypothetical protein
MPPTAVLSEASPSSLVWVAVTWTSFRRASLEEVMPSGAPSGGDCFCDEICGRFFAQDP